MSYELYTTHHTIYVPTYIYKPKQDTNTNTKPDTQDTKPNTKPDTQDTKPNTKPDTKPNSE
jgi:hypothetical protein